MSKGWTEERRAAQAARCRANKPWECATGPKTAEGKARSSMNAYKHGGWAGREAMVDALVYYNKAFIDIAMLFSKIELNEILRKQLLNPHPPIKRRKRK